MRDTDWTAIHEQLASCLKLEADWNSYQSQPIDPVVAERVITLLKQITCPATPMPWLVPSPMGGIQLEWEWRNSHLEIELLPNDAIELLLEADQHFEVELRMNTHAFHYPLLISCLRAWLDPETQSPLLLF